MLGLVTAWYYGACGDDGLGTCTLRANGARCQVGEAAQVELDCKEVKVDHLACHGREVHIVVELFDIDQALALLVLTDARHSLIQHRSLGCCLQGAAASDGGVPMRCLLVAPLGVGVRVGLGHVAPYVDGHGQEADAPLVA
eukprot:2087063-Pyramimonas_sp.AAC.1